jgi:flavin-dependent dehydrogenase
MTNQTPPSEFSCDVAIIGGGPAGSTTAALIRKYAPEVSVLVLEKAKFPRDHVGESQLPAISAILDEMGCWEEIENSGFPLKVGATYRWGKSSELWDFNFASPQEVEVLQRPSPYEGVRRLTAFQVDRAIYDDVLLRHAEKLGATVREETRVVEVLRDGDEVTGLRLQNEEVVTARYYVDATGHVGTLRRAMGVETDERTTLQNVAFWDYWENAEWAVEIGVGATRVQVMSQAAGWLWFIPLGATRTSIGYVVPAEHYQSLGKTPADVYHEAIKNDPRISALVKNATPRGEVEATKDWSFTAERGHGENWFLVGESIGFADPILAAGLTLAHTGARELAYTLVELLTNSPEHDDVAWLMEAYSSAQLRRVEQHIRFADYWYSANGQFTDLKDHCASIAKDAGLRLSPDQAWAWLARGGFTNEGLGQPAAGSFDLPSLRLVLEIISDGEKEWELSRFNVLSLNLKNAQETVTPIYAQGSIRREPCWVRDQNRLPLSGVYKVLVEILQSEKRIDRIFQRLQQYYPGSGSGTSGTLGPGSPVRAGLLALEAMLTEGWVTGKRDKRRSILQLQFPKENDCILWNRDERPEDRVRE